MSDATLVDMAVARRLARVLIMQRDAIDMELMRVKLDLSPRSIQFVIGCDVAEDENRRLLPELKRLLREFDESAAGKQLQQIQTLLASLA